MKTAYTIGVGGTNTLKAPQNEELTSSENEETPELDEYDCSTHGVRRSRAEMYKDPKGGYRCKEFNKCWVTKAPVGKKPPGL